MKEVRMGKKESGNNGKLTKGMPSAVLMSILIHAGLFLLAGILVVFTVVKKDEPRFDPPKAVERPKMKLKKPKVRMKKSASPKSTTRIVTRINRSTMPDIQLPEMSGMGDGLGGGVGGGFDMLADFDGFTMYGAKQSIGNDFEGTFYDYKRRPDGQNRSAVDTSGMEWRGMIHRFLQQGWKTSVFSSCFRAPRKLYATNLVVPVTRSSLAPTAFGDTKTVGALWMVHYKGQLVHKEGITFRFWGGADEFMGVRVDGNLVLCMAWDELDRRRDAEYRAPVFGDLWKTDSTDSYKYYMGNCPAVAGDWITLEPGQVLDMEILIGDNGGMGGFFLAVEEKGVEYPRNRQGAPILPAFKTTELSHDLLDVVYKNMREGEMVCLTNGPVFCDYDVSGALAGTDGNPDDVQPVFIEESDEEKTRIWTFADGRSLEAEFINMFAGNVVLQTSKGSIIKIPQEQLSTEDIKYAELASPPDLDINFQSNFDHVDFSGGYYDTWQRPPEEWGQYGFQIKQTSTSDYKYELQVEMFAIGKQWRRSKYIIFDRQKTSFIPSEQKKRLFEFCSDRTVVVALDEHTSASWGEKHYGYLVTVTDARGKIIAMKSSHKWLPGILENLKKLSPGNFMDDTGVRVYPDLAPKFHKF